MKIYTVRLPIFDGSSIYFFGLTGLIFLIKLKLPIAFRRRLCFYPILSLFMISKIVEKENFWNIF